MKILIGNVHSVNNAGDAVLVMSCIHQLENCFPGARITVAMNDTSSAGDLTGVRCTGSYTHYAKKKDGLGWRGFSLVGILVESFLAFMVHRLSGARLRFPVRRQCRILVDAYLEADIFVSCAGNFLYSSGRFGMAFILALFTMAAAALAGKPLYMMPQTIGPLDRSWERWILGRVLSRYQLLLVRDEESLTLLKEIGVRKTPIELAVDIAFSFQGASPERGALLLKEYKVDLESDRPLLGISLIDWGAQKPSFEGQSKYEEAVTIAVSKFLTQYEAHAVLFSQVLGPTKADNDQIPAKRVYLRLQSQGYGGQTTYIDKAVQPYELKAAYGWTDLFLGTRLHANVFALSEGVPVVAIQYQPKTSGVLRTLDLEEWVVDISLVTGPLLFEKIESAWAGRTELGAYIEKIMPTISEKAAAAGQMIADDYREKFDI